MAFEISYTDEAEDDLKHLLEERQAGDDGLRWYAGLKEASGKLSEMA